MYIIFCFQLCSQEAREFVSIMNGYGKSNKTHAPIDRATYMSPLVKMDLPDEVDWRKKGYVTPVRLTSLKL